MKNIHFDEYCNLRLPPQLQLRRVQNVIDQELSRKQREVLLAVYFERKSQVEIARERGVCPSTVHRTLRRAEDRLRRFLRY